MRAEMKLASVRSGVRNAIFWTAMGYGAARHLIAAGHIPTLHQVGRCYDYMAGLFEMLCDGNLHAGYWESAQDRTPLAEAQERLTDWLIRRTPVSAGSRVLDVGCGNGSPALALARKTGCAVVGITLSHEQTRTANQRTSAAWLHQQAFFLQTDAMEMPFGSETFDATWALESIFHMERSHVLSEMARILRPGGRVLIADLIEKQPLSNQERALIFSLSQCRSVVHLEDYPGLLQRAGFRVVEVLDISPNVGRSFAEVGRLVESRREIVTRAYGHIAVEFMLRMFPRATAIFEQKMGYALVVGEKMA